MNEQEVRAIFLLANIDILGLWQLENKYWPDAYVEERKNSPWWLVKTEYGLIEIGWKKRVISICWSDTPLQKVITKDDTTKNETLVHAWSYPKAIEYLGLFKKEMKTLQWRLANPEEALAKDAGEAEWAREEAEKLAKKNEPTLGQVFGIKV